MTWRIWPGNPAVPYSTTGAENAYTLGTQFSVTAPCTLVNIWWYSPSGMAALPTTCGIWDIAAQALITMDGAPAWLDPDGALALAGDGWVYCDFTAAGVILYPGSGYSAAVFQLEGGVAWWVTQPGYWQPGSGNPGQDGISNTLLYAPAEGAAAYGQGSYAAAAWVFPGADPGNGEVFYVDPEVAGFPPALVRPRTVVTVPARIGRH